MNKNVLSGRLNFDKKKENLLKNEENHILNYRSELPKFRRNDKSFTCMFCRNDRCSKLGSKYLN